MEPLAKQDLWSKAEPYGHAMAMVCDQPILVCSSSYVTYVNDSAIDLVGADDLNNVVGKSVNDVITMSSGGVVPEPHNGLVNYRAAVLHRCDGEEIPISAALIPCLHGDDRLLQILIRDTDEQRKLESHVRFVLRHDTLTELSNRAEFRDRLRGAAARAQRNSRQIAVMLINIDNFKNINIEHGVDAGDAVLQEVAVRLLASVRAADSVARIAGDEFGLLLEAIDQREQAAVVAQRVNAALSVPIEFAELQLHITVSIGIAAYPVDALDTDQLLRMADVAMYAAKTTNPGMFRFYFPDMEVATQRDELRRDQIKRRIDSLTEREREVMGVLMEGNSNKAMAHLLGASPRTIENHRAKVMEKMRADSLPDLVRMVLELGALAK